MTTPSQPIQPQQPQPEQNRWLPSPPPPQPPPPPPQGKQKRKFGWPVLLITAVVALGIGGAVGGSGDGATTAAPQPTVTRTITERPGENTAPTEEPTEAPTQEPTEAPAAWDPKPKDFKVGIKVTDKECFGSAGCSITYKVTLDYLGKQKLPAEGTTDITYEVSGAEDPIIGTLTLDGEGKFNADVESASTTSSSKKLAAKVTGVDYNEFG